MPASRSTADRLRRIARQLDRLAQRMDRGKASREDLDKALAEIAGIQRDAFGARKRSRGGASAKAKILAFLEAHVGEVVYGEQLASVSGIQEWARRVRELRVEDGYDITEVGKSSYRLESVTPDVAAAGQWRSANEIRRRPGSGRQRIEAFLEANVGEVVTREQIDYVGKIAEGSRRVRELRDEEGWPINSHIDEPELSPSEYRLLSTDPKDRREASQRLYPEELRQRVFVRDHYTCQVCGRNREAALKAGDTRFYLEVHHKEAMADELAKMPLAQRHLIANLVTLCHADHLKETAKLQARKRAQRRKP
jgi:5-methylcytosine-specific restriction endonuclease McrA